VARVYGFLWRNAFLPQYLIHRLAFRELINQLVEVANLPHEWGVNLFHAYAAHNAFDKRRIWMKQWRVGKEGLKIAFTFDLALQLRLVIACQLADDLINFFFRAVLAFSFLNIHRVDARKFHSVDAVLRHGSSSSRSRLDTMGARPGSTITSGMSRLAFAWYMVYCGKMVVIRGHKWNFFPVFSVQAALWGSDQPQGSV
jgi:hypothetical protein